MKLNSRIYQGWVRHRRHLPTEHLFQYNLFMMYIDLDELSQVQKISPLFSKNFFSPIKFKRKDYMGPVELPLDEVVRTAVEKHTHQRPMGKICMLTQVRMLGYCFNPVTFYYCFDKENNLESILAEINNTPWNERFHYVLQHQSHKTKHQFRKEFHVSPFFPMDMKYQWQFNEPGEALNVSMRNLRQDVHCFDAVLHMQEKPMTHANLSQVLNQYPLMSFAIVARIYYQAFRLWFKRVPFFSHPKTQESPEVSLESVK